MGAGLVRQHVGRDPALEEGLEEVHGVADPADGDRLALGLGLQRPGDGLVEVLAGLIEVARLEATLDAVGVYLGREARGPSQRGRQGLGPAHATQAAGHDQTSREVTSEVLVAGRDEGLVGPLQDPLGPNVDPGPSRHLPIHDQALGLELAELLPGRPARDEVRVRDQDPRRVLVGPKHAHGLAALDHQGLVGCQLLEAGHDRLVGRPRARGAPRAAIDHEVVGVLRDLRIEVVH
mgnify:CR=1 FL=1